MRSGWRECFGRTSIRRRLLIAIAAWSIALVSDVYESMSSTYLPTIAMTTAGPSCSCLYVTETYHKQPRHGQTLCL